jgi:hypothetical protein
MAEVKRHKSRVVHAPQPVVAATVGLGLVYLATLAAFALAFVRPPAIGWAGFAIVAAVVLAVTVAFGQFLARSDR